MAKSKRSSPNRSSRRPSGHPGGTPRPAPVRPDPEVRRAPSPPLVPLEGYLPPDGANYAQVLRTSNWAPWQPFAGVLMGLLLYVLMTSTVSRLVTFGGWWTVGRAETYDSFADQALAYQRPVGMLGANLGVAMLIPISWLLMTLVHRVRPRWLNSIKPGLRWRSGLVFLAVAAATFAVVQAISALISPPASFGPQAGFWGFLIVIVLSSPLQAAAEEVFFRGYLLQALGSLSAQPWFGVVASAVLFAMLHGTQNLPLFLNRLAFGVLAALLVLRTGGLEAGIAAHVINNLVAYLWAAMTTSIAALRGVQTQGWLDAVLQILAFAIFATAAYLVARRTGMRTTVDLSLPHWASPASGLRERRSVQ